MLMPLCLDKSSIVSGKQSYWKYFCDCLASNKYLKDGLHFVRSLTEVGLLCFAAVTYNIRKQFALHLLFCDVCCLCL